VIRALLSLGLLLVGGDEAKGHAAWNAGRYAEAVASFQAAARERPDDPKLHYNLALAAWRAGDVDAAELAAEKAATLSNGELAPLRDGILGNLRYDAARKAQGAGELDPALASAKAAVDHFARGAEVAPERIELRRNFERAQRLLDELQRQKDEQEKQKDDESKENDDKQKDDEQKKSESSKDEKSKDEGKPQQDEKNEPQKNESEQQPPEPKPESKPDEKPEPKPEPKPDEPKPTPEKADPAEQARDGEPPRELSPEEVKRLLADLQQLEELRDKVRKAAASRRPKAERDW
jgi:hypothetical protein